MSVQSTQKSACLEVRVSLSWSGMRAGRSVPLKSCLPKVSPWCGGSRVATGRLWVLRDGGGEDICRGRGSHLGVSKVRGGGR